MKRYRIISELGKGATGVVYRAVRNQDSVTVALKKLVLPGHLDAKEEEEFIRRFKTEAEAALGMDHPGVVKCLDCGLDEGTFYIAYELVEGVTVEEAIKSGRKFSVEEAMDILIQAADALQFAHEKGVIHRDISTGNIFIGDDGKVKVSDFGVALVQSRATLTGVGDIIGTPGYMSPEQVKGGEIDHRSDIFALGCVIYEVLSGHQAFSGDSIPQIIHKVLNSQPVPIREITPAVPLVVEEIVFRMLAKNPDYRYQTMMELAAAGEKALESIPRLKKESSAGEEYHSPCIVGVKGPYEGEVFNLLPTVTTIGSGIGDVLLKKDDKVESQHAWITKEETAWVLYDADSDGGTHLNGEAIEREEILAGDRFKIGDSVFEFRGAGGHEGAFDKEDADGKQDDIPVVKKKVPVGAILGLSIPGMLVLLGLIAVFIVVPMKYRSNINSLTNGRWDSAMAELQGKLPGSPEWDASAMTIVTNWMSNELPLQESLYPPGWFPGGKNIIDDISFRYKLFEFGLEFFQESTSGNYEVAGSTIALLESRIDDYKVPEGIPAKWAGRKNQLLGIVRNWRQGRPDNPTESPDDTIAPEKEDAINLLLSGWQMFKLAGSDFDMLDSAFRDFQSAMDLLEPLIREDPEDKDAYALSAVAAILGATILRDVGTPDRPNRYQRGIAFLDDADIMLGETSETAWNNTIPEDFSSQFPSLQSAKYYSEALRRSLQNLLATSESANPGEN